METQTLQAEVREGRGKGPTRQLRMKGRIPAVAYGPGLEPTALSVSPKELLKALSTPWGRNAVLKLTFGGREAHVITRDLLVHPVTRAPLHADFYAVSMDREVTVEVPLVTEGRAVGVQAGGVLKIVRRLVPVRATPDKIPALLKVDVTALEIGHGIAPKDMKLDPGVKIALPPERTLVIVTTERKQTEEEEAAAAAAAAAEAAAAAGAPAEGAAAAPAAGAKPGEAPAPAGKGPAAAAGRAAAPAKKEKG